MSVPCGKTKAGLPAVLQIVAPRWGEEPALSVGRALERSHPMGWPPSAARPS
jgi:Asp-tRNA(Asn)/Glu-tRNA(Gln) amidotransferase A subunit family amidase